MQKVCGLQVVLLTGTMPQHTETHRRCKWHQDSSITVRMAKHVEQQNIIEMQCAGAAKQAEEQKKENHVVVVKLMRSYTSWLESYSILNHIQEFKYVRSA